MKKILLILLFIPLVSLGQETGTFEFDLNNEQSIRDYIDETGTDVNKIEGIWEYTDLLGSQSYRLWILQENYKYTAYIIEKSGDFNVGDIKATFETVADKNGLIVKWIMADKTTSNTSKGKTNDDKTTITLGGLSMAGTALHRVYPK